ncbi:MAG: hypothetical protein U1A77_23145 [Pirellulales bacterium]
MLKAHQLAVHSDFDPWDLAVEIIRLRAAGVTETDLRWLVRSGYVIHAREVTDLQEDGRNFLPSGNLSFAERTCFVLTATGAEFARMVVEGEAFWAPEIARGSAESGIAAANGTRTDPRWFTRVDAHVGRQRPGLALNEGGNGHSSPPFVPHWDGDRHELRVGGELVKRFKGAAANQESILAAFEEEGWPPRIDDPLPPQVEQDSKRRLNDTIKCLNKNQRQKLICFHGDGTGEGVLWNFASGERTDSWRR